MRLYLSRVGFFLVHAASVVAFGHGLQAQDALESAPLHQGGVLVQKYDEFPNPSEAPPYRRDFVYGGVDDEGFVITNYNIEESDLPIRLRIQVPRASAGDDPWIVTFAVEGEREIIQSHRLDEIAVGVKRYDFTPVELTFETAGKLKIHFSEAAPGLVLTGSVRDARGVGVEYSQGALRLVKQADADDSRRKTLAAVVRIEFDGAPPKILECNSFQFRPGYFLTNLHCVKSPERAAIACGLEYPGEPCGVTRLVFSDEMRIPAEVVASGVYDHLDRGELDYAILRPFGSVPPSHEGEVLPLSESSDSLAQGTRLELHQDWRDGRRHPRGKVISMDSLCKVVEEVLDKDMVPGKSQCRYPNVKHKCDTEAGSSGAPILLREGKEAVALHFLGIERNLGNCALPTWRIAKDLERQAGWDTPSTE